MFIVRVILGRSYINWHDTHLPEIPCIRRGCMKPGCREHREKFDSVLNDAKKEFRELLVTDPERCYPQYLVTYDRI